VFDVDRRAFTPPPSVTSSIVELVPRDKPLADAPLPALERVVAAAFGQRRKMLRAALKSLGRGDPTPMIEAAGIDPTQRAEELSVEQFCALARHFSAGD
jgi:16S rRNA (adenine1518-N6/adenine1519-N6)-dimethyltransferase